MKLQMGDVAFSRPSDRRIREIVKRRDRMICQVCGKFAPDGEVDHVLPLGRGGSDALHNRIWSCVPCNRTKGNKTFREFAKEQCNAEIEVVREEIEAFMKSELTIHLLETMSDMTLPFLNEHEISVQQLVAIIHKSILDTAVVFTELNGLPARPMLKTITHRCAASFAFLILYEMLRTVVNIETVHAACKLVADYYSEIDKLSVVLRETADEIKESANLLESGANGKCIQGNLF